MHGKPKRPTRTRALAAGASRPKGVPAHPRVEHPTQNPYNRLAHEQLDHALWVAAREHARGRLLDVGCGLKPYAPLFVGHVDEHIGVDHPASPHASTSVDVLATAYDIPLEAETFDTVLMTEVLEHLESPEAALSEAFRLLRPGGKVILTTPLFWVLHEEPRDFFRYSPYGLRHLLAASGFADIIVKPLSGQWATVALLTGYAIRRSPIKRAGRLAEVTVRTMHRGARLLDRVRLEPWMSWNHIAIARKPGATS